MSGIYKMLLSFIIFIAVVFIAFAEGNDTLQVTSQSTVDTVAEQALTEKLNNGTTRFNGDTNKEEIIDRQVIIDYLQANTYNNGDSDITAYYNEETHEYFVTINTRGIENTYKLEVES